MFQLRSHWGLSSWQPVVRWQKNDHGFSVHTVIDIDLSSLDMRPSNDFVEGLWCDHVWELFIANPLTREYVEFNVSPNGDWWACYFVDKRQRAALIQQPEVTWWEAVGQFQSKVN